MDVEEYRIRGKELIDFIADYLSNVREHRVIPDKSPGFLHKDLPESAPLQGESWQEIFKDFQHLILPGVTHWQSPHMHGYFPALNSYPSLLGDMMADAINCIGFTWAASPGATELETIVTNWLGRMIGLPSEFLHLGKASLGGGTILTTASEATLVCMLAGRTQAIKQYQKLYPFLEAGEIAKRLVAYASDQAHSSVEKGALIAMVKVRLIASDENLSMRGDTLSRQVRADRQRGLIPFWVCCTLGSTSACSFDNLKEIGVTCREEDLWLHVDAAYAGSAFICPEYRSWLTGVERADSIAFNPSKWLLVHFDCTAMWVKNSNALQRTFNVDPLYLKHAHAGKTIDYMHWQIGLSKRFRSLKLWCVIRNYGVSGLQSHIRKGISLAATFEGFLRSDRRFVVPVQRDLGLVCFRLKGANNLTEKLLDTLTARGNIFCVPANLKGLYVIRFTVTSQHTTKDDLNKDWEEIKQVATDVLKEVQTIKVIKY